MSEVLSLKVGYQSASTEGQIGQIEIFPLDIWVVLWPKLSDSPESQLYFTDISSKCSKVPSEDDVLEHHAELFCKWTILGVSWELEDLWITAKPFYADLRAPIPIYRTTLIEYTSFAKFLMFLMILRMNKSTTAFTVLYRNLMCKLPIQVNIHRLTPFLRKDSSWGFTHQTMGFLCPSRDFVCPSIGGFCSIRSFT